MGLLASMGEYVHVAYMSFAGAWEEVATTEW